MSVMFQLSSNVKSSPPHENNSTFIVAMLFVYITPNVKGVKVFLIKILYCNYIDNQIEMCDFVLKTDVIGKCSNHVAFDYSPFVTW